MAVGVIDLVWRDHTGTLSMIDKAVLTRMADFGDSNGNSIYPGYTRISKDCSICIRSVKKAIKSLMERGFLLKVRKEDSKRHMAAVFKINIDKLEELKAASNPGARYAPPPQFIGPPGAPRAPQPLLKTVIYNKPPTPLKGVSLDVIENVEEIDTSEKRVEKIPKNTHEEDFEEIWKLYPNKSKKDAALRAYRRALKKTTKENIIKRLKAYLADLEHRQKTDKWSPNHAHLSSWLNGKRWDDVYALDSVEEIKPVVLVDIPIKGLPGGTWLEFSRQLVSVRDEAQFKSWFAKVTNVHFRDGVLYLEMPTGFAANHVKGMYLFDIENIFKSLNPAILEVQVYAKDEKRYA